MSNNNESVEAQGRRGHRSGKKIRDPLAHVNLGDADLLWDAGQGAPWDVDEDAFYDGATIYSDHNYGVNLFTGDVGWYRDYDQTKSVHIRSTFLIDNSDTTFIIFALGTSAQFNANDGTVIVETDEFTSETYYSGDNLDDGTWRTAELIYEYLSDDERYVTVLLNGKHICKVNIGGDYSYYNVVGAIAFSAGNSYIRSFSAKSAEPWKSVYTPYIRNKKDDIFILTNDNYVDYVLDPGGSSSHEANNLMAFMDDNSIVYQTFSDISETGWSSIALTAGYILIPELEEGDILPGLTSGAKNIINEFVSIGGKLIMFLPGSGDLEEFLNDVFSFSIIGGGEGGASEPINITVAGSALFPSESSPIPNLSGTNSLDTSTLPAESVTIYEGSGTNQSVVTMIPYGSGKIYVMGWDWYDASPLGSEDGGWLHLLESILQS